MSKVNHEMTIDSDGNWTKRVDESEQVRQPDCFFVFFVLPLLHFPNNLHHSVGPVHGGRAGSRAVDYRFSLAPSSCEEGSQWSPFHT